MCTWEQKNCEMNKCLSLVHLTSRIGPQSSGSDESLLGSSDAPKVTLIRRAPSRSPAPMLRKSFSANVGGIIHDMFDGRSVMDFPATRGSLLQGMKKIAVAFLVGLCVTTFAQDAVEPPDHGAYYKAKDGWQKLELLTATGNKVGAFSGVTITYLKPNSPVQLSDRRPVFYVKTTPDKEQQMSVAARTTVIVLLDNKDDHRELKVIKSGLFGAKAGYDKKRMPDVTMHSINNLMITITPNEDLAPGEYLLTWNSMGSVGYDFGIK